MPLSKDLAEKSVQAAISAIEVYNKPNFSYREEAFSLLMVNAWELLLKAKWLLDHEENVETLYETEILHGRPVAKTNRSGNPITFGLTYLAAKLVEDPDSGLEKPCHSNLLALVEIRDNAAHFLNKDLYFGRRILEVGTASLRNYLQLVTEWFQLDLSGYNFFLMPISFYHGFETAAPASLTHYPDQVQRLIRYLDILETEYQAAEEHPRQHVALHLETRLVRGKDAGAIAFRWTDDPAAPAVNVREEDVLKNYPMTYRDLMDTMRRRYVDFIENKDFHRLRRGIEKEAKYAMVRLLNPANPKTSKQRFYNANILQEFDKHYSRRTKA
jgi:uncharacterized protein DUF3644